MAEQVMTNLNLNEQIEYHSSRLRCREEIAGKGLMMPNNPTNSGPRKIMFSTQLEQLLGLYEPEIPLLGTGYESRFAKFSSNYIEAGDDFKVLAKIDKFSFGNIKNHHYWLIIQNLRTMEYDVVERTPYEYVTETYGFLYNNDSIDKLTQGSTIRKGDIIRQTNAMDEYGNRMDGANLNVTYISNELSKEDAFIISDVAAEKMAAPLVKKISIVINDNDIPLNMYGNDDVYKPSPDIGEQIINGILLGLRKEKNDESLFAQSKERLQKIMISDDVYVYPMTGRVADIDICCNNAENLINNPYFKQLKFYNDQKIEFNQTFVATVEPLIRTGMCSYELKKMYSDCNKFLNGKQHLKDKPFSNVIIEYTILDKNRVEVGDKLSNRYGGKGVVSAILPQSLMPRTKIGNKEVIVDIVYNSSTCFNRENTGQLFESSTNFIGSNIAAYMEYNVLEISQYLDMLETFYRVVAPKQADSLCRYMNSLPKEGIQMFIDSVIEAGGIRVSQEPMTECMDLDKLAYLYDQFPWISKTDTMVPQEDSNGNIRYITASRKLVIAKQYIYRLKQYGEEKFSAVSLSATNTKNENVRSNSKKTHRSMHSKNPTKIFGEMETGDLMHAGVEQTIIALMLHSASPSGRRLCESLLVDDPFNIDIKLDSNCKNRSAEILNTYLTTMGLRLKFSKIPKNLKAVYRRVELRKPYTRVHDPNEKMIPGIQEMAAFNSFDRETGLRIPYKRSVYRRVRD